MLLEDKNAIVTGAGSGVGRASALRFAEEGAKVVCADLDVDGAKETVRQIEAAGGTAVAVGVDVSEGATRWPAMIAAAVEHFGRLDIVFNNVGIPTPRLGMVFEEHTVEDFERLFAVNVGGVFLGCKHAVMRFKEQGDGGVILNTGSVAGLVGWGGTVYGATKGGGAPAHPGGGDRGAPFGHPGQRHLPGRACRYTGLHGGRRPRGRRRRQAADRRDGRRQPPARPADHRRGLRRGRGVPRVGPRRERHRRAAPGRRRVRRR